MYNQAIQGQNMLLDWYEKNRDYPYFFLYSPNSRESIIDSSPDVPIEEYDFERSFADLKRTLTFLTENSTYGIRLQKKFKISHHTEKRENHYRHSLPEVISKPTHPSVAIHGFDNDALIGKIEKRSEELFNARWLQDKTEKLTIENTELKIKLAASEAKNKEHEENIDGRKLATQAYNDLKPLIPDLLTYLKPILTPKPVAIAGVKNVTVIKTKPKMNTSQAHVPVQDPDNNNGQRRIEIAMDKWFTADPNALELIEKIAEVAEKENAKYNMYKGMLV